MSAIDDIATERRRQVEAEGWTAEHDDEHRDGEMMQAGMCYFLHAIGRTPYKNVVVGQQQNQRIRTRRAYEAVTVPVPLGWSWEAKWWKPKGVSGGLHPRDLERSGALMLAEKDRLVRAGLPFGHVDHKLALVTETLSTGRAPELKPFTSSDDWFFER